MQPNTSLFFLFFSLSFSLSYAYPPPLDKGGPYINPLDVPQGKSKALKGDKKVVAQAGPAQVSSATVSAAPAAPTNAANTPADFVGLGFESSFFPHYDNDFSANLVNSLGKRMSEPVVIRVGGTSGDLLTVNLQQDTPADCLTGDCLLGGTGSTDAYSVGPSYFNAFKRFPNAVFTVQAPMGNMDMNNTMTYVESAWNAIGDASRVKAIALGNEPNYYLSASQYVLNAAAISSNVSEALKLNGPMYELGDLSPEAVLTNQPYSLYVKLPMMMMIFLC